MKNTKKIILSAFIAMLPCLTWAQEETTPAAGEGVDFTVGADLVSSYVWRGVLGAGASVQPALGLSYQGISLGAWGSVDIAGQGNKEVDFTLGYTIAGLEIALTDYWWSGEGVLDYFHSGKDDADATLSPHLFEATLAYTLPLEKFPLRVSWNTFFAGNDYKEELNDEGKAERAFSTYIEASFPFNVKNIALEVALGVKPWESPAFAPTPGLAYGTPLPGYSHDFNVVNLSLKATKEIKITEHFTLPLFAQVIFNPNTEDTFFVAGISF